MRFHLMFTTTLWVSVLGLTLELGLFGQKSQLGLHLGLFSLWFIPDIADDRAMEMIQNGYR